MSKIDNAFESNKNEEDETKNKRSHAKSNLVYNNDLTFYKFKRIKKDKYETQNDKLIKAQGKRIKVQNVSENLPIDLYLDEDDLSLMPAIEGDKQVKLESQNNYC